MLQVNLKNQGVKMFFKSIVLAFLLLIGAEALNSTLQVNQPVSAQLEDNTFIIYQWIDGVCWAFVYTDDGRLIESFPDPIE